MPSASPHGSPPPGDQSSQLRPGVEDQKLTCEEVNKCNIMTMTKSTKSLQIYPPQPLHPLGMLILVFSCLCLDMGKFADRPIRSNLFEPIKFWTKKTHTRRSEHMRFLLLHLWIPQYHSTGGWWPARHATTLHILHDLTSQIDPTRCHYIETLHKDKKTKTY